MAYSHNMAAARIIQILFQQPWGEGSVEADAITLL